MIIISMSIGDQGRSPRIMPPPTDPVPEGYELLKDIFGEAITDSLGGKIYVLIHPYVPLPDGYEPLLDKEGSVIRDSQNEVIYVLKY